MKDSSLKYFILCAAILTLFAACKENRIRSKYAGAWEIEKITITEYIDGNPVSDSVYADCGVWSFVDNGISDGASNRSYLSLIKIIPCVFQSKLVLNNGRWSGLIDWGPDLYSEKRIAFALGSGSAATTMNVEKINRNKFVFFYFVQDGQNNDHIKQMQRFELKRTNQ